MSGDSPETWRPDDAPPGGSPADQRAAPNPTRRPDDRFDLLTLLGRGGMGEVWRARDLDLGRVVAMKIMRPDLPQALAGRFLYEARATAALGHPGIVGVHEVGILADGRPYYTMQEIRGTTLREHIRDVHTASTPESFAPATTGWTLRRLVEAFLATCDAIAYAHARDVIHRDLKPENIMLGDFGEVIVVDWGLVKVVTNSSEEHVMEPEALMHWSAAGGDREGQPAGTVGYMSPEQARGEVGALSTAADVYALGAVLACILTGRSPASSGPDAEALALPRVPIGLRVLVTEAMATRIDARPANARVLADAVRTWLDRTATTAAREARLQAIDLAFAELPAARQDRCRELLLALVDAKGTATPRRADELDQDSLSLLVRAGILSLREGQARLAHPAVAQWPRLRAWVVADPQGQRIRHELAVAAAGWVDRGGSAGDLWRAEVLERAVTWVAERQPLLSTRERAFLGASARSARRRRTLRRALSAGIGLSLLATTIASTTQWLRAEEARAAEVEAVLVARSRALKAEAARQRLAGSAHAAMVLEAAHADLTDTPSTVATELAARVGGLQRLPLRGIERAEWSADGTRLALLATDGALQVRKADGSEAWAAEDIDQMAWSPAGHRLATLTGAGRLAITDRNRARELGQWADHTLAWPEALLLRGPEEAVHVDEAGTVLERLPGERRPGEHLAADGGHRWWVGEGLHVRSLSGGPDADLRLRQGLSVFGFLPDLWRLWTGDNVGGLTLYDQTGKVLAHAQGSGPGVTVAEPSPDGWLLAVGGYDNLVRVLSLADGSLVSRFEGHDRPVHAVAFHPNGRLVASGGYGAKVLLWEVESGRVIAQLADLGGPVTALSFAPDGRSLAVATTQELTLWSPASLPVASLPACPSVRAEAGPGGRYLLLDGTAASCVIDLLTGTVRHLAGVRAIELTADRQVVGLRGDQVVSVDLGGDQPPVELGQTPGARWLLTTATGPPLTIDEDGLLRGGRPDTPWELVLPDWPGWVRHRSLERFATYIDERGGLVLVDLVLARITTRVPAHQVSPINSGWVVTEQHLIVGDDVGRVRAWPLDPVGPPQMLLDEEHDSPVGALAAGQGRLAVGDGDGHVLILTNGQVSDVLALSGTASASSLAWSPDGGRLLVGMDHAALKVVDLVEGGVLRVVDRQRRGLLHTVSWLDEEHVLGVGDDDAWAWELPGTVAEPLTLTNLRVCAEDLSVVAVPDPPEGPWAPAERCSATE